MKSWAPDLDPGRPLPPTWDDYAAWLVPAWNRLLDSAPSEREVQVFLEQHPSLVPGSCGDVGPGGHHGPELGGVYAEPELSGLAKKRFPDFMWVTRSTSLITPICIEIEDPAKPWFNLDGSPTAKLTQALDQLTDWKVWFSEPENQLIFRKTYVSSEWNDRALLPQYVLIYGRASEFDTAIRHDHPDRMRKKRDFMLRDNEVFRTFDSLTPEWKARDFITLHMGSDGPRVSAVPPSFTTGPSTHAQATALGRLDGALGETPLLSPERKAHIEARWKYWRDANVTGIRSVQSGE
jgi:hypothetical protein